MTMRSIAACIAHWARATPHAPAITDHEGTVDWAELDLSTNRLARLYTDRGVVEGDFVSVMLPNGIAFYEACVAAWKLGATPQPLSSRLPAIERDAILDLVSPRLLVGAPTDLTDRPGTAVLRPQDTAAHMADTPLHDRTARYWKAVPSGGSTGRPKVIVATNPGRFNPLVPDMMMRIGGTQLVLGPLYHNAPFSFSMRGLAYGNHLVVMPRFDAEAALALIARHAVDWVQMVPTMMHRIWMLPAASRQAYDVSSVKTLLHTGAACPPWLKQNWIEWLGPDAIHEIYAGTEACGACMISGREWLDHPGSVGRPAPGSEARVLDENGDPLPIGTVGNVEMRRAAEPRRTFFYIGAESRGAQDGWESIGDLGRIDAEGYLYLADRRTDLIISGGANIYPAEIEAAIEAFPGVRSSAVIGLPDEDRGAAVHAIIDAPGGIDEALLRAHLAEHLVRYKHPRSFEYVSESLRDEAGKVRRSALREARIAAG